MLSDLGYMIDLTIRRNRVEKIIVKQDPNKLYRDAYAEALAAGHDAIYADAYATMLIYTNKFPSKDYAILYARAYAAASSERHSEYSSNIGAGVFAEGFASGNIESRINRIHTLMQDLNMRRDLSRSVFAKQCAIRIDKQQKERYNNAVIDNDVII